MIETKFKQTEVGLLPEDWEARLVAQAFTFVGNNTCAREQMSETGKVYNIHYGDILIKYGAVVDISTDNVPFLSESVREIAKNPLQDGDVLMADTAEDETVGKCCEVIGANDRQVETGLHSFGLRPNNKYAPRFLGYAFNSSLYHDQLLPHIQGTKVSSVSKASVGKTFLCCPKDENEQSRIAKALGDIDELIASLNKLIEKKRNIKLATMQQLLTGKIRLKGFINTWSYKELRNHLAFQAGFPFSSDYFNEKGIGIRLIKNRDLKSDDQIYHYDGNYPKEYLVNDGDILIGMDGDFLPCRWNKGAALLNQRVGRLVDFVGACPDFIYYALIEPLKEKQDGTGATTVKHLGHNDIEKISLFMPDDIDEQIAIAKVLTNMDAELVEQESRKNKYEAIKQGMMQQLLTGKIRLV